MGVKYRLKKGITRDRDRKGNKDMSKEKSKERQKVAKTDKFGLFPDDEYGGDMFL
jgi:hypothetical protein